MKCFANRTDSTNSSNQMQRFIKSIHILTREFDGTCIITWLPHRLFVLWPSLAIAHLFTTSHSWLNHSTKQVVISIHKLPGSWNQPSITRDLLVSSQSWARRTASPFISFAIFTSRQVSLSSQALNRDASAPLKPLSRVSTIQQTCPQHYF